MRHGYITGVLAILMLALLAGNARGDLVVTDDFDTWDGTSGRTWSELAGSMTQASSPARSGSSAFVGGPSIGISSTNLYPGLWNIYDVSVWVYDDLTSTEGATPVSYGLYVRPADDQTGGYMYFGFWSTQSTTHYAYADYDGMVTSSLPRVSEAGWVNLRARLLNDTIKFYINGTEIYSGVYSSLDFSSAMLLSGTYVDENHYGAHFDDFACVVLPEPATIAVLGLGGIGVFLRRSSRRAL